MGSSRKSDDPDRSGRDQPVGFRGTAPLSNPEAARTAVFAALNGLVETGLATWRGPATPIELHGIDGETWLLDDVGVTRVR